MFIELHILQNFVPSNLNRDDTNNPKDCEFGGHRRARISSQCLKRAMRRADIFAQTTEVDLAWRTKWLTDLLQKPLLAAGKGEEAVNAIVEAFVTAHMSKLETPKKKQDEESDESKLNKTSVLLYVGQAEIAEMVAALLAEWDDLVAALAATKGKKSPLPKLLAGLSKNLIKVTKNGTAAPDVALFGRMLAEKPDLNLEAACQVAHALSTHRVTMEMDFFTAVDDLNPESESGAGMMGFMGFNSACFYRYARLDWRHLVSNLRGDYALAEKTVTGFIRAAVAAVPTGKQNSTAPYNPPSFIMAVVRHDGMGWSLANAFEKPVYPHHQTGLVAPSVEKLSAYWTQLTTVYGADTLARVLVLPLDAEIPLNGLGEYRQTSLNDLVEGVLTALSQGAGV